MVEVYSEYYKKYFNTSVIVYGDWGRFRTGTTRRDKNTRTEAEWEEAENPRNT